MPSMSSRVLMRRCCVWRATVASHKPRVDGRPGCGLELNMPGEDGNLRSAAEITLGIGYRALAHGLDAEARCAELSQGSEVFFAGEGAAPVAALRLACSRWLVPLALPSTTTPSAVARAARAPHGSALGRWQRPLAGLPPHLSHQVLAST